MSETQVALNFDAPAEPAIVVNRSVTNPAERRRLTRQAEQVLDRLRQGPATAKDLVEIACQYNARIHDLRRAGYDVRYDAERGHYELKGGA